MNIQLKNIKPEAVTFSAGITNDTDQAISATIDVTLVGEGEGEAPRRIIPTAIITLPAATIPAQGTDRRDIVIPLVSTNDTDPHSYMLRFGILRGEVGEPPSMEYDVAEREIRLTGQAPGRVTTRPRSIPTPRTATKATKATKATPARASRARRNAPPFVLSKRASRVVVVASLALCVLVAARVLTPHVSSRPVSSASSATAASTRPSSTLASISPTIVPTRLSTTTTPAALTPTARARPHATIVPVIHVAPAPTRIPTSTARPIAPTATPIVPTATSSPVPSTPTSSPVPLPVLIAHSGGSNLLLTTRALTLRAGQSGSIKLVNMGPQALHVARAIIAGPNPRSFIIKRSCAPHTLDVLQSCRITVRARWVQRSRAMLVIVDDAAKGGDIIAMQNTGRGT